MFSYRENVCFINEGDWACCKKAPCLIPSNKLDSIELKQLLILDSKHKIDNAQTK